MKIFIYDESRVLIRTVGTPDVMQGENNATLIFMSVAGIDESNFQNYLAQFAATIGTSHPADIITDFGTYVLDGIEYKGWKYLVSSKFTQVAGVLNANLVLSSNGSILISQTVKLNVNPSASGVTWFKNITQAQWEQLLAYCVGLRNPNLGVVDTSADPNILDDYNSEAQLGAYLFVEAQNGNLCLLTVGYDDNDEAIIQNVISVHGSALYISFRMYEDGEWTEWTTADGASAISVQTSHFQRIPSTANKVQSALQAIDELMPNNFILADDYCVNLGGHNLSVDGYTFTQSGNDYIIGLPSGETINDWLWRMSGVRRIIASPTILDDPVTIVTKKGTVFTMYKSGANYILKAQATFTLYGDFKDLVNGLGESVTTKSLLVKNGSITNLRANSSQFLANVGGNYIGINPSTIEFFDKGNVYYFPYASGYSQAADDTKLMTKGLVDAAIAAAISSVYRYKGSVSTYSDLPSSDLTVGDVYNVATADAEHGIKDGDNVAWNGSAWDVLAGDVDLSAYATTSWVDSNYMSLTKGGYVNLAEAPAHAYDVYFGARYGTSSSMGLSDQQFNVKTTRNGVAMAFSMNGSNDHIAQFTRIDQTTTPATLCATKVPFKTGNHELVIDDDLAEANAKITALEAENAKQKEDIQYLYRQVIGGGDLITETDSGVSLTSQPFPLTVSPKALLDYVGGMCQKVNQFSATDVVNGVGSTSSAWGTIRRSATPLVYGHKYFVSVETKDASDNEDTASYFFKMGLGSRSEFEIGINHSASWQKNEGIKTLTLYGETPQNYSYFMHGNNTDLLSIEWRNLRIVDLTVIWPSNEPTTTSDARIQWLMSYLASHPEYDADSIITAPVTKVVSKGFNLWDEEWEVGRYNTTTGEKIAGDSNNIRNKNPIAVLPNSTCYFKATAVMTVVCCDSNDNVIGVLYGQNETKALPVGCSYINFFMASGYGTTYNHDICINLSGSLNGTYMPYRAPIDYPIPAEVRALEGYGWGFDADCNNYTSFERKKQVKMIARVDLGSLAWGYLNGKFVASLQDAFVMQNTSDVAPVRCAKYEQSSISDIVNQSKVGITLGAVGYWGGGYVAVYDSAYSDVATFKTAMSGVYLYYEIAVTSETDISEYIDSDVIVVSQGGHLEFENEDDMGVPYSATYQCEPETQGEGE